MPPKHWNTLSSRLIYENSWTRVREDIAAMPEPERARLRLPPGPGLGIAPDIGQLPEPLAEVRVQ